MASPAASDGENRRAEVNYRFCDECANLLYPKEDRLTSQLFYECKTCGFRKAHESGCTYRNQLGSTVTETAGVTTDVSSDPTVGDASPEPPSFCTMCGEQLKCKDCGKPFESLDMSEQSDC